jgi:hypothetical protein
MSLTSLTQSGPTSVPARREILVLDPLRCPDWNRLVAGFEEAGPFHSAAWAAVLHRAYRHNPSYLVQGERNEAQPGADPVSISELQAPRCVLPVMEVRSALTGRRGVALPFTDVCGPLGGAQTNPATPCSSHRHGALPAWELWPALTSLAHGRCWRSIELRGGPVPRVDAIPSQVYFTHTLDLTQGPGVLLERCDSATRRAVRKAERSGLDVELDHTLGGLHEFYALHVRTRRRHGLPPQPFSFFLALHDEIISRGQGFITIARQNLRPVAAACFLHFNGHAVYKYGASDETLQYLRPNNLVMWESIHWFSTQGFRTLHFGRTSAWQGNLRRFKLGWGAREQRVAYYRYCLQADQFLVVSDRTRGAYNRWFKRLPLLINRMIGAVLYRHLD